MLAADVARGLAVGAHGAAVADRRARAVAHRRRSSAVYGAGDGVLRPGLRRDRARRPARRRARRRPTRWTSSCGRSRCGSPGRRSAACSSRCVGAGAAFALDAASFAVSAAALLAMAPRARARRAPRRGIGHAATSATASRYVRSHVWLWATFASAAIAYLLFMGPAEVLLPFVVKNDLHGSAADLGLVFAAGGIGSVGCAVVHRPARPAAARHHLHVRRVDAGHARGRRLRPGHRGLAADARQPRLQRAGDGRHDRVGDRQAAPRARRAARPRLEPRLADLDRPAAAVVRAHRPGQRRHRRAGDADRRRRARRASSRFARAAAARACAPSRAVQKSARPTSTRTTITATTATTQNERPEGLLLGAQRVQHAQST